MDATPGPAPQPTKSYAAWLSRLRSAAATWPDLQTAVLGSVGSYPLLRLTKPAERRIRGKAPRIVLTAGVHGDEPAGVEAVTRLLERSTDWRPLLAGYDLTIFPCANPTGYAFATRVNHQDIDLNRMFDHPAPPPEVALIRAALEAGGRDGLPDLSVELHEDVDSDGFYLYELSDRPGLGTAVIEAVEAVAAINGRPHIEGWAAAGGIIRPDPEQTLALHPNHWPQALYSFRMGTPCCLTFETPVPGLPLTRRAEIHLIALQAALAQHERRTDTRSVRRRARRLEEA